MSDGVRYWNSDRCSISDYVELKVDWFAGNWTSYRLAFLDSTGFLPWNSNSCDVIRRFWRSCLIRLRKPHVHVYKTCEVSDAYYPKPARKQGNHRKKVCITRYRLVLADFMTDPFGFQVSSIAVLKVYPTKQSTFNCSCLRVLLLRR